MRSVYPIFILLCSFLLVEAQAQSSLLLKANGSVHSIVELDEAFFGPGLSVEARLANKWSIALDMSTGSNDGLRMFNVSPGIRYYFSQSMHGFFLGAGGSIYRIKNKDGLPVGYPFESADGATVVTGGFEGMLGLQTVLDNRFSLGFRLGLGVLASDEAEAFVSGNFSAGYRIY